MSDLFNSSGAEFSKCGKYRYKLWRVWDPALPKAMCIGLNPSTANSIVDDPTINNLKHMLSLLGYGGLYMTNLFAYISAYPGHLLTCPDPLGDNDTHLAQAEQLCDEVILCWGAFVQAEERIKQVLPRYPQAKCFGISKNNRPMHPLALMYNGTVKEPKLFLYSDLLNQTSI